MAVPVIRDRTQIAVWLTVGLVLCGLALYADSAMDQKQARDCCYDLGGLAAGVEAALNGQLDEPTRKVLLVAMEKAGFHCEMRDRWVCR